MTIARAEFLRLLPVAVGQAEWRLEGDVITGEAGSPAWTIRLQEKPGRAFGPLRLPVLGVTLVLADATDPERDAFVARFLLGYQRAGG